LGSFGESTKKYINTTDIATDGKNAAMAIDFDKAQHCFSGWIVITT
jgi:hypothetical protein